MCTPRQLYTMWGLTRECGHLENRPLKKMRSNDAWEYHTYTHTHTHTHTYTHTHTHTYTHTHIHTHTIQDSRQEESTYVIVKRNVSSQSPAGAILPERMDPDANGENGQCPPCPSFRETAPASPPVCQFHAGWMMMMTSPWTLTDPPTLALTQALTQAAQAALLYIWGPRQ